MPKFRPDCHMLSGLCETMGEAVSAGLPYREVFAELRDGEKEGAVKNLYTSLCAYAETGACLSECLNMSGVFPAYMIRLLSVGELTGHADRTLSRLSAYYALQASLNSSLKTSVLYPAVLGCVLLCVLYVIATEVLPVFRGIYAQLGADLSPAAAAAFAFGEGLRSIGWILITVILLAAAFTAAVLLIPVLRTRMAAYTMHLFGGKARRFRAAADICSVLAMTCSAGIEPAGGIRMAAELSDPDGTQHISAAADAMEAGKELSASLIETGLFEGMDVHYIDLAVQSGNLAEVAEKLAGRYTERAEEIFFRRIALIEPITVLIMAFFVGLMLLGVMLPLLGALSVLG